MKWLAYALFFGLICVGVVSAWISLNHVGADQILFKIDPHLSWLEVVPLLLLFAIFNSFSEEFLFRGLFFETSKLHPYILNLVQAVAFGLYHFKGFPFGVSGSLLTFAFAFVQGYLKIRSQNFYYIWLAHFVANVGMGLLLFNLVA